MRLETRFLTTSLNASLFALTRDDIFRLDGRSEYLAIPCHGNLLPESARTAIQAATCGLRRVRAICPRTPSGRVSPLDRENSPDPEVIGVVLQPLYEQAVLKC